MLKPTFLYRSTKLYQQFTYAEFYLGETSDELCAMHCAMDTDNRCDFFYFRSHYCYLGSFNQVGGIGVHYCCDQITIRMNKSKYYASHIFRAQLNLTQLDSARLDLAWFALNRNNVSFRFCK